MEGEGELVDLPPDDAPEVDEDAWSDEPLDSRPVYLGFAVTDPLSDDDSQDDPPHYASHIGGHPAYFCSCSTSMPVLCGGCQEPMPLLVQVYAPLDWIDGAYHRALYVFCCPKVRCWKAQPQTCVRVLRCQALEGAAVEQPAHACRVCGKPSSQACGKCKHGAWYCDRQHQMADWQAGHKQRCSADHPDTQERLFGPRFVMKRFDIETALEEMEEEEEAKKPEPPANEERAIEAVSTDAPSLAKEVFGPNVKVQSLMDQLEKPDPVWSRFEIKTRPAPDQVLRYCFGSESPLWVHSAGQLVGDPPLCEHCGSRRVFELQLMPQLLFFLDLESAPEETAMDWATVVVYACEKSCDPPPNSESPFLSEFAWTQPAMEKPTPASSE